MKLMCYWRQVVWLVLLGITSLAEGQSAPFFIWPPTNIVAAIGGNANFNPQVSGTTPIYYQWFFNSNAIPGATNLTMVVSNVQVANAGIYSLYASNSVGTLTSSNVNLYLRDVYAWGAGSNSAINLGNYGQSVVPTNLGGVIAVAGGGLHSLALQSSGRVSGWGENVYGETSAPGTVTNAIAIAAGYFFSLALQGGGTVTGWGDNQYQEVQIPSAATNVTAIAAGWYHSLALRNDGTVVGWGATNSLGLSPYFGQGVVPAKLTGVTAIAAGGYHSLALLTNGTVVAWGWNAFGQTNVPAGLNNVVAIAAGGSNSMALLADGTLVAWGANAFGQTNVPAGLGNVVAISAGAGHDMALEANGTILDWGLNSSGQTNVPAAVTNVTAISAGGFHSLALVNTGPVTFMAQPWRQTVWEGSNAVFTAYCLGYGALAYQWMENGTNVPGATNASLVFSNAQLNTVEDFQVTVSNSFGAVTSAVAALTVQDPAPFMALQPANASVLLASNFTVSGAAGGLPPFSYQWYFDGSAIPAATNAVLTVTNAQVVNRGLYSLLVSNSVGTVMSSNAYVNVIDLPEALGLTNVAWYNEGYPLWSPETTNTHDGFAAAGVGIALGQASYIQTYVTGPGTLTFWYYAPLVNDFSFAVDESQFTNLNFNGAWHQYSCYLPARTHQLTWQAAITGYSSTTNYFFLGDVTFTPGNTAATIGGQPASQTVTAGGSVTFSATVTGTPPLAYQWYSNGVPVSGWTGSSITLNDVQSGAAGNYWVVVSGPSNVVTSSTAVLTVTPSVPVISTEPVGGAVLQGNAITLSGGAKGTEPMYYQWLLNGAPIPGATGTVFGIANMGPANAGTYTLVASNSVGVAMSSNAVVTIYSPSDLGVAVNSPGLSWTTMNVPWFPETNTTVDGVMAAQSGVISGSQSSVLQTTVTGPAMVVYWWQVNCDSTWDALAFSVNGTVQSSITGTIGWEQMTNYVGYGPQVLQWKLYPVHGSFAGGTAWLDEVQVIPIPGTAPAITNQTGSLTVNAGNSAAFSAAAAGTPALYYQWEFNGAPIPGATNASLTVANVQDANAGEYSVTVTNEYGSASSTNAALTVDDVAPTITSQPASQTNSLNVSATFSVSVKGSNPFDYQWLFNGQPMSGASGNSLTIFGLQFTNAGGYSVVVSNGYGAVTSSVAHLTVTTSRVIEYWNYGFQGWVPTPADPGNVIAVAAGEAHTLALLSDGTVLAWGGNEFGQTNVPGGLTNVAAIAAGTEHSLALQSNGTVVAWGEYGYGQGGVPPGLSNVVAIAAGPDYNLALKNDGTVTGWGDDIYGQTDVPAGLTNVQSIFAGYYGAYAICTDGSLVQWGNDLVWSHNNTNTTLQIGGSNVVSVVSGALTGWSLDDQGVVQTWGVFDGVGPSGASYPGGGVGYVADHQRYTYYGVTAMAASGEGNAADDWVLFLNSNGTISDTAVASAGIFGPAPYIAQSPFNVTAISACAQHAVALINDGSPYINWQPAGRVAYTGDTVTFGVGVSGVGPMSYQWLYNGASVSGATNSALVLTNVPFSAAGSYACVITNNAGAVTSQTVSLTVLRSTPQFGGAASYSTNGFSWELNRLSGHGDVIIESSTDLVNWVPIYTNPPVVGSLPFTDPGATNQAVEFYRALEQ